MDLQADYWLYLPMQKSLNILPNNSSTSTFPTIIPRCLVASLKSSADLSKSCADFFFRKEGIDVYF